MPKFFVPGCEKDPELGESTYAAIKAFMNDQGFAVTDRRIFRVEYLHAARHRGKMRHEWDAEVGKTFEFIGEPCFAIFEAVPFLVCTPTRGVARGEPVLIGEPYRVIEFD